MTLLAGRARAYLRDRSGPGLPAQPGRRPRHPDADGSEGRRLLQRRARRSRRAYHRVTLTDLDRSGTLTGSYAQVLSDDRQAGHRTPAAGSSTRATRTSSSRSWATSGSPRRSATSSRWASARPANVNNRQQLLRINQYGGDNSFYRNGTSKLDDHARQGRRRRRRGRRGDRPRVRPLGAGRPGAGLRHARPTPAPIGEAFGDYLAVTVTAAYTPRVAVAVRRRLGLDVVHLDDAALPAPHRRHQAATRRDLVGEVHADGEIWSSALYAMNTALGRDRATKIIIGAQFGFTPTISMPRGRARSTVDYARKTDPKAVADGQGGLRGAQHRDARSASSSARARAVAAGGRPWAGAKPLRDHGRHPRAPRLRAPACSTSSPTWSSSAACRATRSRPTAPTCCSSAPSWAAAASRRPPRSTPT